MITNDYERILSEHSKALKKMENKETNSHCLVLLGLGITELILIWIAFSFPPYTIGILSLTFLLIFIASRVDLLLNKQFTVSKRALCIKTTHQIEALFNGRINGKITVV